MKQYIPLNRRVENDDGHAVTIIPRREKRTAEIEVGTDTSYVRLAFRDPNALRSIAGHLMAVADEVQRHQQEVG